jgi:hypothetical protein
MNSDMSEVERFRLDQERMPTVELVELLHKEASRLAKHGLITMHVPCEIIDTDMFIGEAARRLERLQSENEELKSKLSTCNRFRIEDASKGLSDFNWKMSELQAENENLKSRKLTMSRYRDLDNQITRGEITLSRLLELINEHFTK